jgi:hypothetical protein
MKAAPGTDTFWAVDDTTEMDSVVAFVAFVALAPLSRRRQWGAAGGEPLPAVAPRRAAAAPATGGDRVGRSSRSRRRRPGTTTADTTVTLTSSGRGAAGATASEAATE